jgi:inner membrane protein
VFPLFASLFSPFLNLAAARQAGWGAAMEIANPKCFNPSSHPQVPTMPTIFSHAVAPLAIGLGLGARHIPRRLLIAGVVASVVPDADVIAFRLGIAYEEVLGHRGISHSLVFAALLGLPASAAASWFKAGRLMTFLFIFLAAASHGLLDMLTSGGLGVAILWPWTDTRYFFPWRPVRVSPFSLQALISARGAAVALSELRWIWLPSGAAGMALYFGIQKRGCHGA